METLRILEMGAMEEMILMGLTSLTGMSLEQAAMVMTMTL